jgi:predicted nucleic acid-binding protein
VRYFDTSVVAAVYVPERLSRAAQDALRGSPRRLISDLTRVELASALGRRVREESLSREDAACVIEQFQSHLAEGLYDVVALTSEHYSLAFDYLAQMTVPLRALDAIHCAAAFTSTASLVTADRSLARCAAKFGIRVELLG